MIKQERVIHYALYQKSHGRVLSSLLSMCCERARHHIKSPYTYKLRHEAHRKEECIAAPYNEPSYHVLHQLLNKQRRHTCQRSPTTNTTTDTPQIIEPCNHTVLMSHTRLRLPSLATGKPGSAEQVCRHHTESTVCSVVSDHMEIATPCIHRYTHAPHTLSSW